ncbi:protein ROLLING AND ERECT LEAF 2-like [Telopea speciosissima]|uniref:protein ROLLING AND ERECT LEAF 2-like n=1 Tax=Telopea speciosissima TaxID=54955 RepID=UPI001CC50892|nr:protein ROLLING AND ERECT LEAF 2-like [Telopea speciosissima]XP_043713898.1 protein ROLLING AND ERECT LEAF 2-like [Telopea speciosissima]
MGCSTSKLDNEEAVQLCKDRKNFIKQALEQRTRFASGHIAYIQSLKRVSAALRNYVEGDEPREFFFDSFSTPSFTPVKKTCPSIISISSKPFSTPPQIQSESNSTFKVNYLRSGGNPSISVEERPQSPATVRIDESYSSMHHFGIDGFFAMQSSPMDSSFFSSSPNRPSFPPRSPQTGQWDFFWNPFTSLDACGYPTRISLDQTVMDDETEGLRQVREEEGIPDLEEEVEEQDEQAGMSEARAKIEMNCANCDDENVIVEDDTETDTEDDTAHGAKGLKTYGTESVEASEAQNTVELEISNQEMAVGDREDKEETPGFTVYVNRRPTCMAEVIKDLEAQFMIVCNSANEVSTMLEATKAQYPSTSNELTAVRMLNPVSLFRSASSRSSSSRCLYYSSISRDDGYDSSSDISEESCMFSGSHQSTLDRLYAWEKKLYEEVKAGERVRVAYEKKFMQLKNQDVKGERPSVVHKTKATIKDLHTQIKVSIHSVEAVSKRIETLRDEELQPQLLELIQGLARMWKVMAECHRTQKRTIDEAKLLLAGTPLKRAEHKKHNEISPTEPHRLARSAANLETELRNWQACFESWIAAQRSYVDALKGWLLRCVRTDPETSKLPCSPRRSGGAPPIFGTCIQWSRFLDDIRDIPVIDGLDFFAAGVGSVYTQQLKDDSRRTPMGSKRFSPVSNGNMEVVEVGQVEEEVIMSAEKIAEVAIRVLCAGMSVVMSSLTEFAMSSTEGYADLVKQWENASWTQEASKGVV